MFNGGTSRIDLGIMPTLVDTHRAGLHPRRRAVRHRDLPSPHPAAWRRSAAGPGDSPRAALGAVLSLSAQPKIAIPTGLALAWLGYALMTERQAAGERGGRSARRRRVSTAAMSAHDGSPSRRVSPTC